MWTWLTSPPVLLTELLCGVSVLFGPLGKLARRISLLPRDRAGWRLLWRWSAFVVLMHYFALAEQQKSGGVPAQQPDMSRYTA